MTEDAQPPLSGVLPRAHAILATIAPSGATGMRLKDIAEYTGIARPTVYRMLHDLIEIGFVEQRQNKRYTLGQELSWLGISAPPAYPQLPVLREFAEALAEVTGDTVYISAREGAGVRYLLRVEGDYPLQSRTVSAGQLIPYTASYSGLALLAHLSPDTIDSALAHVPMLPDESAPSREHRVQLMREVLTQVRERTWCTAQEVVVPGLSGMAAIVPNPAGQPVLAVSISAPSQRLTDARAQHLAPALLKAAAEIGDVITPPTFRRTT